LGGEGGSEGGREGGGREGRLIPVRVDELRDVFRHTGGGFPFVLSVVALGRVGVKDLAGQTDLLRGEGRGEGEREGGSGIGVGERGDERVGGF